LADGEYSFSVEATRNGEKVTATSLKLGMVSALTRNGNSFVLDLGAQGSVNFNDVQQII
jgi:flagellar basal-body rod modification protein FlgD